MRFTFTLALVLSLASILTSENAGAVFLGLSGIITALFIGIVNVVVAWKTKGLVDEVKTKAEVIVGHVNSEKTAAEGRQRTLEAENALLRQMIEEKKLTAALLAQSTAAVVPPSPSPPSPPSPHPVSAPPAHEELQKIEKNTADTAANTAKTDSNVQGLVDDQSKSNP